MEENISIPTTTATQASRLKLLFATVNHRSLVVEIFYLLVEASIKSTLTSPFYAQLQKDSSSMGSTTSSMNQFGFAQTT